MSTSLGWALLKRRQFYWNFVDPSKFSLEAPNYSTGTHWRWINHKHIEGLVLTTINFVFSATKSICLALDTKCKCSCSVINTKCEPNSIRHSLWENLGIIDLHCYNIVSYQVHFHLNLTHPCQCCMNILDAKYTELCFNNYRPLFKFMTMFYGTDNIMHNIPHIHIEHGKYFIK